MNNGDGIPIRRLWQLLAAFLLLLATVLGAELYRERHETEALEHDRLAHLARVVEANLSLKLQSTGHALDALRAELPVLPHDGIERHLQAAARPGLPALWLLDVQGQPLAGHSAEPSLGGPACASRCRELLPAGDSSALHVSQPFQLPSGGYAIGIAQRLGHQRSGFTGYLLAILGPDDFQDLLAPAAYAPDVNAALLHASGRIILRVHDAERLSGQDISQLNGTLYPSFLAMHQGSGIIHGVAASQSEPRIAAFQQVRPLAAGAETPLWVAVSRSQRVVSAHWYHELALKTLLFAVIAVVSGVGLLAHQHRRRALDLSEAARARESELALSRLSDSDQRVRGLFEHLPVAYQSLDITGRWLDANQQMADLLGFEAPQQLLGLDFCAFWDTEFRDRFDGAFDAFKASHVASGEIRLRRPDGRPVNVILSGRIERDAAGNFVRTHCVLVNISERHEMEQRIFALNAELESKVEQRTAQLARANDELRHLAHHDALTGLANRRAAADRLRQEFAALQRDGTRYALLLIDIDHFKCINDSFGHEVGDHVIEQVAATLRAQLRESDLVARFGGEEFLVLLPATGADGAFAVAEPIRRAIGAAGDAGPPVTVSIGVAIAAPSDSDEVQAIRRADLCLYQAKRAGRNRIAGPLPTPALAPA